MRELRHQPVRRKLLLLILAAVAASLALVMIGIAVYEFSTYRNRLALELGEKAGFLAANSAPTLAFDDAATAREILATLQASPEIAVAALYTAEGEVFASFVQPGRPAVAPPAPGPEELRFAEGELVLVRAVEQKGRRLGTLYLQAETAPLLRKRLIRYAGIFLSAALAIGGGAFLLQRLLQRLISEPLLQLSRMAERIAAGDLQARVPADSNDEIGELAKSFNRMTGELAHSYASLRENEKLIEQELQKAQKLESVGLLAGGIAHDFNNILTAILGNVELARMLLPPEERAHERLAVVEQAVLQARGITQQLLTFAKGGAPVKKVASVERLIRESVDLALRGANVKTAYRLEDDLWRVEVDEGQIRQVLSNLAINADQAMPRGGTLTITARNEAVGRDNPFDLEEGRYIRIEVADQGVGIPQADLGKIFDPYFTTKEKGSGLGLSISYSIIKRHGGSITVQSRLGEGTSFTLFLPATEQGEPQPAALAEEEPRGTGRVLVMDDDEVVSAIAAAMLQHLGYQVRTVSDGALAVAAYQEALAAGEPFAAVITDLTVPGGMGGQETARRLLELDPEARIIVSSGYANDPIMSEYAVYGFQGVIPKPYNLNELGRTLQKVIGRKNKQNDG